MLKILEIKLQIDFQDKNDNEKLLNIMINKLLLSYINEEYREFILGQIIKPYTQSILFNQKENIYVWKISTLNTEATKNILYVIKDKLPAEIFLQEYNVILKVQAKNYIHSATYRQLVEKYFATNCRLKSISWQFVTPTIFYNSENTILPQIVNLLDNIIYVWNLFADENILQEKDLSSNLAQQIYIIDYDFNIKPVVDDDKKIPSLTGFYYWGLKHNIMAKKIICILIEYAQYCGIGKNTDLGMGNVNTIIVRK